MRLHSRRWEVWKGIGLLSGLAFLLFTFPRSGVGYLDRLHGDGLLTRNRGLQARTAARPDPALNSADRAHGFRPSPRPCGPPCARLLQPSRRTCAARAGPALPESGPPALWPSSAARSLGSARRGGGGAACWFPALAEPRPCSVPLYYPFLPLYLFRLLSSDGFPGRRLLSTTGRSPPSISHHHSSSAARGQPCSVDLLWHASLPDLGVPSASADRLVPCGEHMLVRHSASSAIWATVGRVLVLVRLGRCCFCRGLPGARRRPWRGVGHLSASWATRGEATAPFTTSGLALLLGWTSQRGPPPGCALAISREVGYRAGRGQRAVRPGRRAPGPPATITPFAAGLLGECAGRLP